MIALPDFYRFSSLLQLSAELKVMGFDTAAEGAPAVAGSGFHIKEPSLLFVAPARTGPVLGYLGELYPIEPDTEIELDGEGAARMLRVSGPSGRDPLVVPAPPPPFIDPSFIGEPDMYDFFVWLQQRLPMTHVRESLTYSP